MGKNLVVCLDGTDNEFGKENTNVVRLYQSLVEDPALQCIYYDPGVGTMGQPGLLTRFMQKTTQILGLAFGLGVTQNVIDAYLFLMRRYQEGDQIYLFGFSRGALEARALAAMLHRCGLLKPDLESLAPYAVRVFQTIGNWEVSDQFRKTFSRPVDVKFLGLWDTVTAFGNVWTPIHWPYTTNNKSVRHVRHAIALDERRAFFRQNRWADHAAPTAAGVPEIKSPQDSEKAGIAAPPQDAEELWFIGVHCDVGGGYPPEKNALWTQPMQWMAKEAVGCGLQLDELKLETEIKTVRAGCGDPEGYRGAIHDSMRGLGPLWPITEVVPKRRWVGKTSDRPAHYAWLWPIRHWFRPWLDGHGEMGRARELRAGEKLHHSVLQRFVADAAYRPDSLKRIGMTEQIARDFLATATESYVVPPEDQWGYKGD